VNQYRFPPECRKVIFPVSVGDALLNVGNAAFCQAPYPKKYCSKQKNLATIETRNLRDIMGPFQFLPLSLILEESEISYSTKNPQNIPPKVKILLGISLVPETFFVFNFFNL